MIRELIQASNLHKTLSIFVKSRASFIKKKKSTPYTQESSSYKLMADDDAYYIKLLHY